MRVLLILLFILNLFFGNNTARAEEIETAAPDAEEVTEFADEQEEPKPTSLLELEPIIFDKSLFEAQPEKKVYHLRIDNYTDEMLTIPDFSRMPEAEFNILNLYNAKNKYPHMSRVIPIQVDYHIDNSTLMSVGQVELSDFNGHKIRFISERETMHDEGAKIYGSGMYFDYSAGIFSSTLNNTTSAGSIISTKPINLFNKGYIRVGGAHYGYDLNNAGVNTIGIFSEYVNNRLILGTQFANTHNFKNNHYENKIYILPELMLTNSLSVKFIHQQNLTDYSQQNGFGLKYKPKGRANKFEFEIDTTTKYYNDIEASQRLNFSTKFKL